ncbi:MAG TPA: TonB-dependent receptor [Novosphingobium sp.]|nr:TonB-dependent receptor [Novosphingobium sp.]
MTQFRCAFSGLTTTMAIVLAGIGIGGGGGLASAQTAPPAPPPQTENQLGDIVVTAQRTGQRLQDVPVSVTAISGEQLDRLQVQSLSDVSRLAPNVKFDAVTGGSNGLKPYIRGGGITDGGFVTSESEVAIYVDDVYRARLEASLLDFVELDRIEVLRGPQGVLYGRNSSAGAVNIITKAPSDHFEGSATAGYGSFNERRFKAFLSSPISADGKWRASLNGMIRARDGGAQYNSTLNRQVGANDFAGIQGDLAYVGDAIQARFNAFYLHSTSDGQYAVNTTTNSAGQIVPISGSYRVVQSPTPSYSHLTQYGSTLRMSATMPHGKLTSITGYSKLYDDWREDFSGGVAPSAIGAAGTAMLDLFDRVSVTHQHQFSEELQASGSTPGGFADYVGGLYYFTENATQGVDSTIFFVPSRTVFTIDTNSYAAYGQVTLHLARALSLVGAGRYTIDDKRLDATIGGVPVRQHNSYERFTPKIGLNYTIAAGVLAYASYSEGFKSGGYNGLASNAAQLAQAFRPQITKAYEVGLKTDFFAHKVRLNLAAFDNSIIDRQQTVSLNNGSFLIENYDVSLRGIEAELSWRVVHGLTLWGNGALNDGKYTGASAVSGSLSGHQLPVLPKYSFTVGFDYNAPVGPGIFTAGADYSNRDKYFSTPDNAAIGAVPSQEFLNGYLGYEMGKWKIQLAAKNLLQQQGWQTGFRFSVINPRFAIEPRSWMLTLRYKL